jgi:serine/threonine protein kinase
MFYRKSAPELYSRLPKTVVHQTDAEIQILKILRREFIYKGVTPCILEIIFDRVCEGVSSQTPTEEACDEIVLKKKESPFTNVSNTLCRYADLVAGGLAHDKCAFVVLERCDMSFDDYLKKDITTPISASIIRSLLFQIVYTMYAIKRRYPKYHHYDLHTENVMLKLDRSYKFSANNQKYLKFTIPSRSGGTKTDTFIIPYFGIIAKIIDFGFSAIPEEGVVSDAVQDRISMFNRSDNDLLFLFHWIAAITRKNKTDPNSHVIKMLKQLDPTEMFLVYNTERIRGVEDKIPSYEDMVYSAVFKEFANVEVPQNHIYGTYQVK